MQGPIHSVLPTSVTWMALPTSTGCPHMLTRVWFGCVRTPKRAVHSAHPHTTLHPAMPSTHPTGHTQWSGDRGTDACLVTPLKARGRKKEQRRMKRKRTGEEKNEKGGERGEGRGGEGSGEQGRGQRRREKEMGVYQKMMGVNKFRPSSLDADLILLDSLRSN